MSTMIVPVATTSMRTGVSIRAVSRIIQNGVLSIDSMARFGWLLLAAAALIGVSPAAASGSGLLLIGLAGLFLAGLFGSAAAPQRAGPG